MAESERFARAVQVVARGLARIGRERARRTEVTPQQAETLLFIAEKGAVSTSHMAVVLGIDPSTASRNLAGLEKAGYVTRRKGADDGRQTDIRLTPRGKRIADGASTLAEQAFADLLEKLPRSERQKITDGLELVGRALDGKPL